MGRDAFFSFSGLDAYRRGIRCIGIGVGVGICNGSCCFRLCLFFKRSRGAGGDNCPSGPHPKEKHPEKEAEGGQSYPGDTAQGEVKSKMSDRRFLSGRRRFFAWRHWKVRNFNYIRKGVVLE